MAWMKRRFMVADSQRARSTCAAGLRRCSAQAVTYGSEKLLGQLVPERMPVKNTKTRSSGAKRLSLCWIAATCLTVASTVAFGFSRIQDRIDPAASRRASSNDSTLPSWSSCRSNDTARGFLATSSSSPETLASTGRLGLASAAPEPPLWPESGIRRLRLRDDEAESDEAESDDDDDDDDGRSATGLSLL
eukprot:scaffold4944_cov209-Pinguiococcus_pyrenoidosus.AAC.3